MISLLEYSIFRCDPVFTMLGGGVALSFVTVYFCPPSKVGTALGACPTAMVTRQLMFAPELLRLYHYLL